MEVLIIFLLVAVAFAWALPQEEIDELNKRINKKK